MYGVCELYSKQYLPSFCSQSALGLVWQDLSLEVLITLGEVGVANTPTLYLVCVLLFTPPGELRGAECLTGQLPFWFPSYLRSNQEYGASIPRLDPGWIPYNRCAPPPPLPHTASSSGPQVCDRPCRSRWRAPQHRSCRPLASPALHH